MKFKTMTSLVVLAALSCGEKASAVLQGPFGDVINQDSRMVPSFKAPLDTTNEEQGKAALARATAVMKHRDTAANAFLADPRVALMAYYVHQLEETVLQAPLAHSNSVQDKLHAIENYDSSGSTSLEDYIRGISVDLTKGQGAFNTKKMAKLEDAIHFATTTTAVQYFVQNGLDLNRLAYLFRYSQYGLEELTGVTSSPSSHTVTSSLMPPSFEDYLNKKKVYLQQVRESEELAKQTLTTSKLEEETALSEEEEALQQLEKYLQEEKLKIAQKKQRAQEELTLRREEGLRKAYDQAFETVELLDGSLESMLNEVGGIWDNAFRAVTSIPDIVNQSNLAAEELMRHAERVNRTEEAAQFVTSKKRTALQKLTGNVRLFLDHQANFLQDPVHVAYRGQEQEALSNAARNFCVAQDTLQKTEKEHGSAVETLKQTTRDIEQLSQMVREEERALELLRQEAEEFTLRSKRIMEEDSFHHQEEGFSHEEGSSQNPHRELESLLSSRQEYELGVSGALSHVSSLQEELSRQTRVKSTSFSRALQIDGEVKLLNPQSDSEKISSLQRERVQQTELHKAASLALSSLPNQIEEALAAQKRAEKSLLTLVNRIEELQSQVQTQHQSSSQYSMEEGSTSHVSKSEELPSRDFESEIQGALKKVESKKAELVLAQETSERLGLETIRLERLIESQRQDVLDANNLLRKVNTQTTL